MELALLSGEFSKCAALAWEDWVDMHALFQTARPPFGYLNSQTLHAIQHPSIKKLLESGRLLITLDAGPHPHFFWIEADLEVKYTIEKLVSETGETLLLDQLSSGPQVEILL
jgi:mevalonate pyrophosphate decarboxylase